MGSFLWEELASLWYHKEAWIEYLIPIQTYNEDNLSMFQFN